MSALLLIIICLSLGLATARFADPPPNTAQSLNWWVINVALPALVLDQIPRLHFNWSLWYLSFMPWILILITWACVAQAGRFLGWSRSRVGAIVLTCGFGNTSFLGYPMIEALRGRGALSQAVVYDQIGTFLALSLFGLAAAAIYSGQRARPVDIAKRVLLFPSFIAMIIAVTAAALGGWPEALGEAFGRIGSTLTPLALFSVGLQFRLKIDRSKLAPIGIGLAWKLAATPVIVYLVGRLAHISGPTLTIATLEAAMAPMISAGILAEEFGLEPVLANAMVGLGTLLSLFTVPIWNLFL